jgi:hypothetical protein
MTKAVAFIEFMVQLGVYDVCGTAKGMLSGGYPLILVDGSVHLNFMSSP